MGMDLLHGGHLTHGSPANRSGKLYKIVSYGIDPQTERLNYDQIEALAREAKPKMIIAGYTSYPWMPDWARFRQIADAVGAYLLADISHIAGMVAAGVVPSPVGHAHVVSFTTHKTLYGPRGACILTTDKALAGQGRLGRLPRRAGRPARQRDGRHGRRVQAGRQRAVPGAAGPDRQERPAPRRRAPAARPAHPVRRHGYPPAARRHEERASGNAASAPTRRRARR